MPIIRILFFITVLRFLTRIACCSRTCCWFHLPLDPVRGRHGSGPDTSRRDGARHHPAIVGSFTMCRGKGQESDKNRVFLTRIERVRDKSLGRKVLLSRLD